MSLTDTLNHYFTQNIHVASEAMHGDLHGYLPWKPKKDQAEPSYVPSDFEIWADPQGIKANCVASYGGEDQGTTYYSVYKFTQGDISVYIKFSGWYASYNGAEYQGFSFVVPKEVTKIEYI